jgi:hypothetical protein
MQVGITNWIDKAGTKISGAAMPYKDTQAGVAATGKVPEQTIRDYQSESRDIESELHQDPWEALVRSCAEVRWPSSTRSQRASL